MKRSAIKAGLKNFCKVANAKGLDHYLSGLSFPNTPIKRTDFPYDDADIIETQEESRVVLFFKNTYSNKNLNPTHIYHLVQLGQTKYDARRIGALHFVLNPNYITWLTGKNATFNYYIILADCRDKIFENFKNENMYSDNSINQTLDNLAKWRI